MSNNRNLPGDQEEDSDHDSPKAPSDTENEKSALNIPADSNEKPINESMEVQHHPDLHHKRKKFREYLLEFLMIFLAVTMGFIAENLRERISDRNKEKEYIESLVQDLKTDTALAANKIKAITAQMYGMDTLEMYLTPDVNKNDSAVFTCYRQHLSLHNENTMIFSNRTITQLFSSGNMRLIKNQSVSDRITEYYSVIKDVDAQKAFYIDYFTKCLDIYQRIYEFDAFRSRINGEGEIVYPKFVYGKIHIATTNANELIRYKSTIEFSKRIINSYRADIDSLNEQAGKLLGFLNEEYRLKEK